MMDEAKRKSYGETAWMIETLYPRRDFWLGATLSAARKGARGEELSGIEESLVEMFERSMASALGEVERKGEG